MFDVITIGDATLDMFVEVDNAHLSYGKKSHRPEFLSLPYAEKIAIDALQYGVGGNAANVAVGVKKLGLETALLSQLGADMSGEYVIKSLQEKNVDTTLVKLDPKGSTRYSVILTYGGERTILSYFPKRSYRLPKLPATKWLYYTSLGASFEKVQASLIAYLRKHKEVRLACNPGSFQLHEGLKNFRKILPFTDLLFLNKEEAEKFVGKKKNKKELITALHKIGVGTVVLTDSTEGAIASANGKMQTMGIYPVRVVSKTGAGDAFASGYLAAILHGEPSERALEWGAANAAGVVQQFGAEEGLLNEKQVKHFIKKYPRITSRQLLPH